MNFDFTKTKKAFDDSEIFLKQSYLQISTGRANPALLDGINIDSYGSIQPIKNISSISLEDARTMRVTPWDKSHIQLIEKALFDSKLPISVSVDSIGLRVNIPQLTEEGKGEIVKLLKEKLEAERIKVRNIRQDIMKQIEKAESNGDFAEDSKNIFKDQLQKMVDSTNKNLDELFNKKEADIMSV